MTMRIGNLVASVYEMENIKKEKDDGKTLTLLV